MALRLRGIFSIPASPFDEIGELDFDGLRRQVEFSIACGAGAVIGPVMASEVWRLTLEERQRFVEVLVRQAAGRLPVIAGVSARNAEESVELARCAAAAGAEAVIAMLPSPEMSSNWEETHRFFSTLAERAGLPVILQNGGRGPLDQIPVTNLMRLVRAIEPIQYIKEEGAPSNHRISELLEDGRPTIKGVIGGMGGRHMIDEMRRGACGFAPICTFTDVLVRIFQLFHAGEEEQAMDIHEKLTPLLNIEFQVGMSFSKELLVRRGLIRTNLTRADDPKLDRFDIMELEARWERIKPHLRNIPEETLSPLGS